MEEGYIEIGQESEKKYEWSKMDEGAITGDFRKRYQYISSCCCTVVEKQQF